MDIQKLSAPPAAASVGLTPRSVARPTSDAGDNTADSTQLRLAQLERSLSDAFPPELKLQLDLDRTTNTVVGRVIDRETGAFVRQIPSKEMIALMARSAEVNAVLNKKV